MGRPKYINKWVYILQSEPGVGRRDQIYRVRGGASPESPARMESPWIFRLDNSQALVYTSGTFTAYLHGDRSSIGRALDCGSSGCGFKPHRSPFLFLE